MDITLTLGEAEVKNIVKEFENYIGCHRKSKIK